MRGRGALGRFLKDKGALNKIGRSYYFAYIVTWKSKKSGGRGSSVLLQLHENAGQ